MAEDRYSDEMKERLLEWLSVPFDLEQVEWKPQSVSGQKALVVPFAGPRAYSDRLNLLFGIEGWSEDYDVQLCPPGQKIKKRKDGNQTSFVEEPYVGKVLVVCTLHIFDIGLHKGTGECEADDPNALTSADAMAFKRACSRFGLGRYFYDMPATWAPYQNNQIQKLPELPAWALPRRSCFKCKEVIGPAQFNGINLTALEIAVRSLRAFDHEYCAPCSKEQRAPKAERKKA